jgi:hypothetical protein
LWRELCACAKVGLLLSKMKRWLLLIPMCAVIAAGYYSGEWYPLSSFPMYSKFDDRTYYVYLADREGEPVPTVRYQIVASELKKHYRRELNAIEEQRGGSSYDFDAATLGQAGARTMQWLRSEWVPERAPDQVDGARKSGLQLVEVRVYLEDGEFRKRETVVGRWTGGDS